MEIPLAILLLLCALCSAATVPCTEINSVLLGMTEKLTEHKMWIQQLKEAHEQQAAKLKELENKDNGVGPVKAELEEQGAKLKELEGLTGAVKKTLKAGQVAFTATFQMDKPTYIGPYNLQYPVVFNHVLTNVGNAYSPTTGYFTAPVAGVYSFDLHIYGYMYRGHGLSGAVLVKDGVTQVMALEKDQWGWGSAAAGATLHMEAGSIVHVVQMSGSRWWDDYNHHCVFSGHMVFPLVTTVPSLSVNNDKQLSKGHFV